MLAASCTIAEAEQDLPAVVSHDQPVQSGQLVCAQHDQVVKWLLKDYAEVPISIGLSSSGAVLEVFASPGGDTWTIVVTMPNGTSCLVANGEGWYDIPRAEKSGYRI